MKLTQKEFERLVKTEMKYRLLQNGGEMFAYDTGDWIKDWIIYSTETVLGLKDKSYAKIFNMVKKQYPRAYKKLYNWGQEMITHTPSTWEDFVTIYNTLASDATVEGADSDCWYDIYLGKLKQDDLEYLHDIYEETDLIKFHPGVYEE